MEEKQTISNKSVGCLASLIIIAVMCGIAWAIVSLAMKFLPTVIVVIIIAVIVLFTCLMLSVIKETAQKLDNDNKEEKYMSSEEWERSVSEIQQGLDKVHNDIASIEDELENQQNAPIILNHIKSLADIVNITNDPKEFFECYKKMQKQVDRLISIPNIKYTAQPPIELKIELQNQKQPAIRKMIDRYENYVKRKNISYEVFYNTLREYFSIMDFKNQSYVREIYQKRSQLSYKHTEVEPYGTTIVYHYKDDENFQKDYNNSADEIDVKEMTKEEVAEESKIERKEEKSEPIKEIPKPVGDKPKQEIFEYIFPPIHLLNMNQDSENYAKEIEQRKEKLEQTFRDFKVNADIVSVSHGARFTRFEIQIGKGVRIRDVLKIEDDIKLNLEAAYLHIEAPIPGKTTIGIDIENKEVATVTLREMIESKDFQENPSNLVVTIGKDTVGNVIVESLENMCHLLIGGTTGTGKSACINSIIMSILYKADPNGVKLILIDTKAINLSLYNGIPHLMIPVVTDLRKATAALQWCVAEMTERYRKFADFGARDLTGYNIAVEKASSNDEPPQKIPRIVIVIDDFSDLMIVNNSGTEESICRLAQMGRAAGIHIVISTQRPSVDVVTGIIKANIPSRIAFNVFSAIDSRIILDEKGAEDLLSDGDMLFSPFGARKPIRVQGTFVSDEEIENVVDFVKNQMIGYYGADYVANVEHTQSESELDPYFIEAGKFVIDKEKASIGMLQRIFKIGFNRAARIMDQLAEAGVVGEEEGIKPRRILMSMKEFERYIEKR